MHFLNLIALLESDVVDPLHAMNENLEQRVMKNAQVFLEKLISKWGIKYVPPPPQAGANKGKAGREEKWRIEAGGHKYLIFLKVCKLKGFNL